MANTASDGSQAGTHRRNAALTGIVFEAHRCATAGQRDARQDSIANLSPLKAF